MRRISAQRQDKKNLGKYFQKGIFTIIFILLLVIVYLLFHKKYWKNTGKLAVLYPTNGQVNLLVFNVDKEEMVKLVVPQDLYLPMSYNLGDAKVKNIWRIGFNEGYKGTLLTRTLVKNLNFPVYAWGDSCLDSYYSSGVLSILKLLAPSCASNLTFSDKLNAFFFSLQLGNYQKREVDLKNLTVVKKDKLPDGDDGYTVNKGALEYLLPYTINNNFAGGNNPLLVKIINRSENREKAEDFGRLIESMGGKVIQIYDDEGSNVNCKIGGKNSLFHKELRNMFNCGEDKENFDGNVETVTIGKEFVKNY